MKTQRILAMIFLLLAASATFSQTSAAINAAANRSWPSFWRQITAAINKKDRAALKKMMANNFSDESGGLNGAEWLKYIDENERKYKFHYLPHPRSVTNFSWRKGRPEQIK